jgi:hypothetical protein
VFVGGRFSSSAKPEERMLFVGLSVVNDAKLRAIGVGEELFADSEVNFQAKGGSEAAKASATIRVVPWPLL